MYRLSYFIPLVALIIACYFDIDSDFWWAYLLLAATALGIIALMRHCFLFNNAVEYLSGYVICVQHLYEWVEKVVTKETKYDSRGQSHTEEKIEYKKHPEEWHWFLNTGYRQYIGPQLFNYMCWLWQTPLYQFETYHANCVEGGGGEKCYWNQVENDTYTVTYPHRYTNPMLNSQSLFKSSLISAERNAKQLGLFDYPGISDFDQQVILCHPELPEPFDFQQANKDLQHLNAFKGMQHEIHVFILLFKAEQGMEIAWMQRDYWKGLNKNEFVICLGVEGQKIKWCQALSWMDLPTLGLKTQDYFSSHEELDLVTFVRWLRKNLDSWKRKEFKDFEYLPQKMSKENAITYWTFSALLGILVFVFCLVIGLD